MDYRHTGYVSTRPKGFIPAVVLVSLLFATQDSNAMAGFLGEYTLFSAVSGRLLNGDQPVAGATISQSAKLGSSDAITKTTVTDDDGSFSFPPITRKKGFSSLLPQQFAAGQSMTITVDGESYEGWVYTKMDPAENSENNGQPSNMVCDISKEPEFAGQTYGVCKLI